MKNVTSTKFRVVTIMANISRSAIRYVKGPPMVPQKCTAWMLESQALLALGRARFLEFRTKCKPLNSLFRYLEPSYKHRHAAVDYKRQIARGTCVEGVSFYAPSKAVSNRLDSFEEPFTEEESDARMKRQRYDIKLGLALLAGVWTYYDFRQSRPLVWCSDQHPPHPPHYSFKMRYFESTGDVRSIRRGYEVYRQVCSTCHSMKHITFRRLVDEVLPEKRLKEIAATYDYEDGPNQAGEMFKRPGKMNDTFPHPYPNTQAARYANGGAKPPDLSMIIPQREGHVNYIMSLLTGYLDPPYGLSLRPGLYYNTWFEGGIISMAPPLSDGLIEYEDGTPATVSQMAKDVCEFLSWTALPDSDQYKKKFLRFLATATFLIVIYTHWNRFIWAGIHTRRINFGPKFRL